MPSIFNPVSTFPTLLSYGLVGPMLLRWFVALFLIYLGRQRWFKSYKWMSVLYIVVGIFIGIGLYTQIGALAGAILLAWDLWTSKKSGTVSLEKKLLYALCILVLISLLFTGAGFFAFDLPL